jgi:hypothetical protein
MKKNPTWLVAACLLLVGLHVPGVAVGVVQDGRVILAPTDFYDYQRFGVGPNGALNSTVNDMLKYLPVYLEDGRASGGQVISAGQVKGKLTGQAPGKLLLQEATAGSCP